MFKKGILWILLLLLPVQVLAEAEKPDVVLEENVSKVLDTLNEDGGAIRQQPERLHQVVDGMVLPLIDFEAMSKLTLAKHWKKASPEQRTAFVSAYRGMLVRAYTSSLAEFAGQTIRFFPNRTRLDGKYATVFSELVPGNGKPNKTVKYSMREKSGRWQVYDITIDGLSFVKNYRTSFGKEIVNNGLDALIKRLKTGEDFS